MFKALKGWLSVAATPFTTSPFEIMRPMPLALPPAAIARLTAAPLPPPGAAFKADPLEARIAELEAERTILSKRAAFYRQRLMRRVSRALHEMG